jgi:hypothetical protein
MLCREGGAWNMGTMQGTLLRHNHITTKLALLVQQR